MPLLYIRHQFWNCRWKSKCERWRPSWHLTPNKSRGFPFLEIGSRTDDENHSWISRYIWKPARTSHIWKMVIVKCGSSHREAYGRIGKCAEAKKHGWISLMLTFANFPLPLPTERSLTSYFFWASFEISKMSHSQSGKKWGDFITTIGKSAIKTFRSKYLNELLWMWEEQKLIPSSSTVPVFSQACHTCPDAGLQICGPDHTT